MSFGVIEGKESEGRGIQLPPLFVRFFKMLLDYVTHSNNHTKGITRRGLFRKEQKLECFLTVFNFGLFFSYFFFIYMYILGFSMQGGSSQDVPVALQCLEEMLKKRRKQVISCKQSVACNGLETIFFIDISEFDRLVDCVID